MNLLQKIKMFASLPESDLDALAYMSSSVEVQPGSAVVVDDIQGDPTTCLYIVEK